MKAELRRQNGKFEVVVGDEVFISVSNRTNLLKNFRSNKRLIGCGIVELYDGDKLLFSKIKNRKKIGFSGQYADVLNQLITEKEFKHSDMLKRVGLSRPNTELLRELNKFDGVVDKINLGVGKGVLYKVIKDSHEKN